jgi:hypothetical protein
VIKITISVPAEGCVANPLHQGILRNKGCPCLSGRKVKKCCGQHPFIDGEYLQKLLNSMQDREAAARVVE